MATLPTYTEAGRVLSCEVKKQSYERIQRGVGGKKFMDGKWTPWLNDIASNLEHGTKQVKSTGPLPGAAAAYSNNSKKRHAHDYLSIGALSRANAALGDDNGTRLAAQESRINRRALQLAFAMRHQVEGGSWGSDSRAAMRARADAYDE